MVNNQNGYGNIQKCCICKKPLEKARVVDRGTAKCKECKQEYIREYIKNRVAKKSK